MRVHRFRNSVAVNPDDGPTFYLDAKAARALARQLNACAKDTETCLFQYSEFRGKEIETEANP